ncbi:hypothetical protein CHINAEXTREME_13440 [Halobiforma lacisalsi AJ5]|uniref:Halobacterial output domain-containing protein n=1 Tax=Natronobacterium lacisalsi AJ5 TaxID=358396 RepID=M0LKR2_NATLA|nr:HalOD1 output domain-containing protein [Halobiforma lacisalsi]APW98724.1 hypothetical protein CHINAEXTREME_13440 [Halobiforma lacisalsi AJ5]EMA32595.1 hypothetical protein C445_10777 [Halobiforma lacisalsi AJ5]
MSDNLTRSDSNPTQSSDHSPAGNDVTEVVHDRFDASDDSVVVAVVETVATVVDRDPLEMPPLFESVDTEALETLVRSPPRDRDSRLEVTFSYLDCPVTVSARGDVVVEVPGR